MYNDNTRAIMDALEDRLLMASFSAHINFQPAAAPVPAGYLVDAGNTFADRGNGYTYGWNQSLTAGPRDRNSTRAPDQRYDTFNHMQQYGNRTWEIAVPNGEYEVHLVSGDPDFTNSVHRINV